MDALELSHLDVMILVALIAPAILLAAAISHAWDALVWYLLDAPDALEGRPGPVDTTTAPAAAGDVVHLGRTEVRRG